MRRLGNRCRTLALALILAAAYSAVSANAQESVPGDACTGGQQGWYRQSGGADPTDGGHFLFCNGSNWQAFLTYTSGGELDDITLNDFTGAATPNFSNLLENLSDVNASGPADGQCLKWVNGSSEWQAGSCDGAIEILASQPPPTSSSYLSGLSDVDVTGVGDGNVLLYSAGGTNWVVGAAGGSGGLWTAGAGDDIYYNSGTPQVGIGTTSPGYSLHVVGSKIVADTDSSLSTTSHGSFGQPATELWLDGGNSTGVLLTNDNGGLNANTFLRSDDGSGSLGVYTNHPLLFWTNDSERMRIDGGGAVTITTEETGEVSDLLMLNNTNGGGNAVGLQLQVTGTPRAEFYSYDTGTILGSITSIPLVFKTNDTEQMRISGAGFVGINNVSPDVELDVIGDIEYTGTITDMSDRRFKADIMPLDDYGHLHRILALKPVSFRMKDDADAIKELGFIAQDVQDLYPELVKVSGNGTLSLNYVGMIAPMVRAIQEQQVDLRNQNGIIQRQVGEVEELRAMNAQLLSRIEALEAEQQ